MADVIPFSKYEGLGNDFVLIDDPYGRVEIAAPLVVALCDRHLGIGADGLLVVKAPASDQSIGRMGYWNRDGGAAEMCGNGVRCLAKHLRDRHGIGAGPFVIETGAGPVRCRILEEGDAVSQVEVEMSAPQFDPASLPMRPEDAASPFVRPLGDRPISFTPLSAGNPHIVTFDVDAPEGRATMGPALERDPAFPNGVNVGFARMAGAAAIDLDVFERGCGFTKACGTGACAAVAAACRTGRVPWGTMVEVRLPGGTLHVTAPGPDQPIRMKGPARRVFEGTFVVRHLVPGSRD